MDALTDVLSLLKPRSYVAAGFDAAGDWCLRFDRYTGIKFNAVVAGACWLSLEGMPEPIHLTEGDCFLLPAGRPFKLASDLAVQETDASTVFTPASRGGIAVVNGGGEFFLAGSRFTLEGAFSELLLGLLPPLVQVREDTGHDVLRWSLDRIRHELSRPRPGSALVTEHLAHLMLIEVLRLYLAEGRIGQTGWLFALSDKQIGAAIDAMHSDPGHRWTVKDLGTRVGMSRTAFAVKFKSVVGMAPMEYLARWRMLRATADLADNVPIARVATDLGYESESAFGAAFKRITGRSPRHYARSRGILSQEEN